MAKLFVFVCVFALWTVMGVNCAHHHAPAPSVDCSSLVLTMADCLTFVTSGSKVMKPEGGCCSGLKNVLKSDAACLCEAFKNSAQFGVVLNITKAATLPTACNVKAPSITNCGLSVSPAGAPANSPTASAQSPAPASGPDASDMAGSSVTPAAAPAESGASTASVSFLALVSLLAASCLYF